MAGGFALKSHTKQVCKEGFEAAKTLENDPNITKAQVLATAKNCISQFEQLDSLPDAQFIHDIDILKAGNYDIYRIFWWWRKAHEDGLKRGEDDDGFLQETRYRTFMVTQFLKEPFDVAWNPDRDTLQPGTDALITEEQIQDGLDHASIKQWAVIKHDRDIYTAEDEIRDRRKLVKAGEKKFTHYHIMLDIPGKVPISTVAKWFKVPGNMVDVLRGRGSFLDGVQYLFHETKHAVEQNKTHYDYDEAACSPGFDVEKEMKALAVRQAQYGMSAKAMTEADIMRMHVLKDGWTMRQCEEDNPVCYAKIRSTLAPLRLDYLGKQAPPPFRMNIYIDGNAGIGKSSLAKVLASAMFSAEEHPYFAVGNDSRVSFERYDGEPVIIWNDFHASDFVSRFGTNGAYKILDTHPDNEAQQAKGTSVILTNEVNIINGVEPYNDFINSLADRWDSNQAWRRFPLILRLQQDDIDILMNRGFIENDSRYFQQMYEYNRIRGNMGKVAAMLGGPAKAKIVDNMTTPIMDAVNQIRNQDTNKITSIDEIPAEFADYGKSVKAEYEAKAEAEKEAAIEQFEKDMDDNFLDCLQSFAYYVFNVRSRAYLDEPEVAIREEYEALSRWQKYLHADEDEKKNIEQEFDLMKHGYYEWNHNHDNFNPNMLNYFSTEMLIQTLYLYWIDDPIFQEKEQ